MNDKKNKVREALKLIPSIDEILNKNKISTKNTPVDFIKYNLNNRLNKIRKNFLDGNFLDNPKIYIDDQIQNICDETFQTSLRPVINGTGIILHTGLGRAPISKEILIEGITQNYPYSNLEININNGKRGDRNIHISTLVSSLCNVEESIVVNNNAAAVMLTLNSLCNNKEVIISRGQQVEIGGSFRIPDVIDKSNCNMVEIGTTNKTHIKDYENAINKNTGAILYVHTSNYKVIGFTNEIDIKKLSELATKYKIPLILDLGSGSIVDFKSFDLPMEKMIKKYVKLGGDIITFSGDKLLGGPQSGIISGKSNLIKLIKENSIYRAVRCDKIRISILENILRTYYSSKNVSDKNLTIQLFLRTKNNLKRNAKEILKNLSNKVIKDFNINYKSSYVEAGSGSLPTEKIESIVLCFKSNTISSAKIYNKFLNYKISLVGYIKNDIFHIDLKAIPDDQLQLLIKSINELV
jgi:L-seryl-tRNA(Ser) seleniumtransferase